MLWRGPQRGETAISAREVDSPLAQSERAAVKVLGIHRYSEGCVVDVHAMGTVGEADAGEILRTGMAPGDDRGPGSSVLRFKLRLADGREASNLDQVITPSTEPEQPYFAALGGPGFQIEGNHLSIRQSLRIWPTPGDLQFHLEVE